MILGPIINPKLNCLLMILPYTLLLMPLLNLLWLWNNDLEKNHIWSPTWLVLFNPKRVEPMMISRKMQQPIHHPLIIEKTVVFNVKHLQHLGVVVCTNRTCDSRIDLIRSRMWRRWTGVRDLKIEGELTYVI